MNLKISVRCNDKLVEEHSLGLGIYTIGKGSSEICLNFPTVSKKHALLHIEEEFVFIEDAGSKNGTFLNSEELFASTKIRWDEHKILKIGPYQLRWSINQTNSKFLAQKIQAEQIEWAKFYEKTLSSSPANAKEQLFENLRDFSYRHELYDYILEEFHGDGPLKEFLNHENCREIITNDYDCIFVDLGNGLEKTKRNFLTSSSYEAWVVRMAAKCGRRLDLQNPICDGTLPNGSRFHGVISPISHLKYSVAIRKFGAAPVEIEDALNRKWIDLDALDYLKNAVLEKKNIVISGGTSTGKTSFLNFLCRFFPEETRVVSIEDTVELHPPIKNLVQLQARVGNADGNGEVSLRKLIQCALRMRPDRIIVGECRGPEVLEMLQALNTGHPGSLTTLHANNSKEALHRLELLTLLGATNLTRDCVYEWIRSSIDLVVQLERDQFGNRFVTDISCFRNLELKSIYSRKKFDEFGKVEI